MLSALANLSSEVRQYLLVTGNYWAFTLTDGALRMLVVLHFHQLGYNPLEIALLFLFYEFFGVVTNLVGGWLGARIGLNKTMNIGLSLQVIALLMLTVPASMLTVPWVMAAQAFSGIAKDLNKMSAKSSVKQLAKAQVEGHLYKLVAILTGSKNTLKGVGFFLGGMLLSLAGFTGAVWIMIGILSLVLLLSLIKLKEDLGKARVKPKFTEVFSTSAAVNALSAARLFLFGARDIWFVVALPVYLSSTFDWDHWAVGGFLASWIIAYGCVQAAAPWITGRRSGKHPDGRSALRWAMTLTAIPALIALGLSDNSGLDPQWVLLGGLGLFGVLFAINSSLHSYLIVSYAKEDGASMDVGFYYMANASGRLIGTLLSGWLFQVYGFSACLWISALFLLMTSGLSLALPRHQTTG